MRTVLIRGPAYRARVLLPWLCQARVVFNPERQSCGCCAKPSRAQFKNDGVNPLEVSKEGA